MVVGFERRDRDIAELAARFVPFTEFVNSKGLGPKDTQRLVEQFVEVSETIADVEALGVPWDEDFRELVRAAAQASTSTDGQTLMEALAEEVERLARIRESLESLGDADSIAAAGEQIAQLTERAFTQEGQIRELSRKLGGVLPSCWTRSDGSIDYVFDVVLSSGGVKARRSSGAEGGVGREPALPPVDVSRLYSPGEFLSLTKTLFDWSRQQECRFYVVVYDATAVHEKDRYKELMQTVEGHFYKRQSNALPPF